MKDRDTSVWPARLELVVFDFDGVFTDNRVLVDDKGGESVFCSRSDGLAVAELHRAGVPMIVLSTEKHPVVAQRCTKLKLRCFHGIDDKRAYLARHLADSGINPQNVVYLGNDVNDLGCFQLVGLPVAVQDAHESVLPYVRLRLATAGGLGAVRELADLILSRMKTQRWAITTQSDTFQEGEGIG